GNRDHERNADVPRDADMAPVVAEKESAAEPNDDHAEIRHRFDDRRQHRSIRRSAKRVTTGLAGLHREDLVTLGRTYDSGVNPALHFGAPFIGRLGPPARA